MATCSIYVLWPNIPKKYILGDEQGLRKIKNSRAYLLLTSKMRKIVLSTLNSAMIDEIQWVVSNNDILQIPAYSLTKDKLITVLDLFVEDPAEEFIRMANIASCRPDQVRGFMIATMNSIQVIKRYTDTYPNEIQVWRFVAKFCNNIGRYLEPRHYNYKTRCHMGSPPHLTSIKLYVGC